MPKKYKPRPKPIEKTQPSPAEKVLRILNAYCKGNLRIHGPRRNANGVSCFTLEYKSHSLTIMASSLSQADSDIYTQNAAADDDNARLIAARTYLILTGSEAPESTKNEEEDKREARRERHDATGHIQTKPEDHIAKDIDIEDKPIEIWTREKT